MVSKALYQIQLGVFLNIKDYFQIFLFLVCSFYLYLRFLPVKFNFSLFIQISTMKISKKAIFDELRAQKIYPLTTAIPEYTRNVRNIILREVKSPNAEESSDIYKKVILHSNSFLPSLGETLFRLKTLG